MPIPNESCIHCGQPADNDDPDYGSGRVHERCWDAFIGADDPVEVKRPMQILGVLFRFLGMAIIIGSAFLIFLSRGKDGGPLILALVGAGMHFAGRKAASGAHAASVTGGVAESAAPPYLGPYYLGLSLLSFTHSRYWVGYFRYSVRYRLDDLFVNEPPH